MNKSQPLVRQTSKVEKIPDDEHEGLLQQKSSDNPNETRYNENTDATTIKGNEPVSNALVRALSCTEETVTENTKIINGDVHISIPSKTITSKVEDVRCYRNCRELNTEICENDIRKGQNKVRAKSKCSRQTVINVVFGFLILSALVLELKDLFTERDGAQRKIMYCYQCSSVQTLPKIIHVNNMCCTEDPITDFPLPVMSESHQLRGKPSSKLSQYNGTRTLEFQADFHKIWKHKDEKAIIPWRSVTNIDNSFSKLENQKNTIRILRDGNYEITLILTTDGNKNKAVRFIACLIIKPSEKDTPREECRKIIHFNNISLPFEVYMADYLQNGTSIHAHVTQYTSKPLDTNPMYNKLFLVML